VKALLASLASHYRRHPVQAAFLLLGIVMANVLLVGTQVINAQARASYAQGERLLGAGPVGRVVARDGSDLFEERRYIELRRAGFHELAPLLRRIVVSDSGEPLELLGLDGLAMPRQTGQGSQRIGGDETAGGDTGGDYGAFSFPPYEIWGAPARLRQLGLAPGDRLQLADGRRLPPARPAPDQSLGHRLVLDVGALQDLTDSRGRLSAMMVFDIAPDRLAQLEAALPPGLAWRAEAEQPDPVELTRSFHLNLAAMGLLSFVVGVFLVYNALAFSYTDRRVLIRRLRLAGVPRAELGRALLIELVVFLVVGAVLGAWLGALLAARLLPGVGQTLAQLYGVYIQYPDGLVPGGLWPPVFMTALAGLLCAAFPLRQALHTPMLDRGAGGWDLAATAHRDRLMAGAGLALLAGAAVLARTATGVFPALGGMACLLLGAALLLPLVLRGLLAILRRAVPPRRAALRWLLADSRWLLGPASLALMAVTLALVANSGLNTMIGSFRTATDQWLEQRLTAQLYLRGTVEAGTVRDWMAKEAPAARLAERHSVRVTRVAPGGREVQLEVVDLPDADRFVDSIQPFRAAPGAVDRFRAGEGVLISERAWRLDGWSVGDTVRPCEAGDPLPVVGIYRDYGNPNTQWMVSRDRFENCWPETRASGQAVFGPDELDWGALALQLQEGLGLEPGDLVDQRELRAVGLAVFDRTFTVTRALNALTLIVAGIGIFCAVSAIHHHRFGQQALLASLGLGRRERGALLFLQWGVLGLLSMVLVWPFGTLLAGYLAGVVTPVAFGWSFPLVVQAAPLLGLAVTAIACLLLAVALPSLRLLRTSPGDLLRWQSV